MSSNVAARRRSHNVRITKFHAKAAYGSGVSLRQAVAKGKPVHQARGYRKLRKGRRSIAKHFYLVTTQTEHRAPIFTTDQPVKIVLNSLEWFDRHNLVALDTAVIMPDHVHMLVQLGDTPLDSIMQRFKSYTSKQIGILLKNGSRFWQAGYHDHAVRKEEDLNQFRLYCLDNPVRAKIVDDFHDYPYWYSCWDV